MNKRDQIRRELLSDPAVVAAVVEAVHERVPAYTALDGSRLPEVRAITAWGLERLLDLWVTEGEVSRDDLRRFRGIAAARAADGRPLPAVLRAYRVAATVLADQVAARAPRLPARDALALARLLLAAVDTISEEMTTAYAATADRLTADRDRALHLLLDDLIAGRHASLGALTDRASRLDVQLPERYCLLAAEPGAPDEPEVSLAAAMGLLAGLAPRAATAPTPDSAQPPGPTVALATTHGSRAVLLLPAGAAEAVPGVLRAQGWRGCVIAGESLDRVAVAHRLAAGALDTAPPHAHRADRVLTDADAHVLALLAGHPVAGPERIGRIVLGPLAEPGQRHLLDALTAYIDTGSANAAARALHLHPQSVRYRLRRVRAVTGRDPQDPWQRLTFDIARTIASGARPGGAARR
ncbi:PucR family transcriptional regulator [Streptomyces sp. NPDC059009]|uniref:PucR family transcriptional regulator n=1 Tax=Streptomyces sp. NPDC059009 TaxID=3346694 RepID=UPI0036846741